MDELRHNLISAIKGDLGAFERVKQHAVADILEACEAIQEKSFTTASIVHVIHAYIAGTHSEEVVQSWGDFARFGYLITNNGDYIETPFERDSAKESIILEAVARLGEIGDLIDGEPTKDELDALLRRLFSYYPTA